MADHSQSARNILIVGVVLGLAAGGLGAYSMVSGKIDRPATELNAPPAKEDALVAASGELMKALARNHSLADVAPEGVVVNGKPRFTPIFYSPDLWQVAIDEQKKNIVMDVLDPSSPNIHGDVPNAWFVANGLLDDLGKSDALTLDSDGDGFTNFEEFSARTNPSDSASFPPLVAAGRTPKLEVTKVLRDSFIIQVDSNLATDPNPVAVTVKLFRTYNDTRPFETKKGLKAGDPFGVGKDDSRFTVVGFVRETYSDSTGASNEESAVKLRDNVTIAGEKEFVVRAGSIRSGVKDRGTRNEKGHRINDSAAELRVTAGPAAGKPNGTVTVAEGGEFKVPGAEDIVCKLETIDDSGSVNILPPGAQSPVNVPRAASASSK